MIEPLIYTRLCGNVGDLLGDTGGSFGQDFDDSFDNGDPISSRIYPVYPTQDSAIPFVVYTVTDTQTITTLHGPIGSYQYSFTVEAYALTFTTVTQIAQAIRDALDGWTDASVKYCSLTGGNAQAITATGDGEAYLYQLSFTALAGV